MKFMIQSLGLAACAIVTGCAYVEPSEDARAQQRYETYAPKFTDEEKASLSDEEKLAIYNKEVRKKDRLVCRREQTTGSHFRRTRCFTQQELAEARRAAEDGLRQSRKQTLTGNN